MEETILSQIVDAALAYGGPEGVLLAVFAFLVRGWLKQSGVTVKAQFAAVQAELGAVRETLGVEIRAVRDSFMTELDAVKGQIGALDRRVDKLEDGD